jgi:hypothetical protein
MVDPSSFYSESSMYHIVTDIISGLEDSERYLLWLDKECQVWCYVLQTKWGSCMGTVDYLFLEYFKDGNKEV